MVQRLRDLVTNVFRGTGRAARTSESAVTSEPAGTSESAVASDSAVLSESAAVKSSAAVDEQTTREDVIATERQLQRSSVERDRAIRESRVRRGQQPESVTYW